MLVHPIQKSAISVGDAMSKREVVELIGLGLEFLIRGEQENTVNHLINVWTLT